MPKFSPVIVAVAALLTVAGSAYAQGAGGSAAGTAPTASSTTSNSASTVTTIGRSGSAGSVTPAPGGSGDATVDAKDRAVDTKIKSICKGC